MNHFIAGVVVGSLVGGLALIAIGVWLNKHMKRNHGANSIEDMRENVVAVLKPGG